MHETEQKIRRLIPGGEWWGSSLLPGVGVGVAVSAAGAPRLLAFAAGFAVFSVLVAVGLAVGIVLAGIAALAETPSGELPRP